MTGSGACSIEEYLRQLRAALYGETSAVIREALDDAEEHLRSEVAANSDRAEGEVLALITSTYGAPEHVAAIYRTQAPLSACRVFSLDPRRPASRRKAGR
jgi:hypothetical protein